MARKRMIDPEFWLDEAVAKLSPMARLLYIGLWGICDDNYATFPNRPDWIKVQVFPYEKPNVRKLLDELSSSGKITLFEAKDGEEYYFIKNFFKYQRVDHPSSSKYPQYMKFRGQISEGSARARRGLALKLSKVKLSKVNLSKDKLREESVDKFNSALLDGFLEKLKTDFPLHNVDLEIEKMRDFLRSSGKTYRDYPAFMRNWLRRSTPTKKRILKV